MTKTRGNQHLKRSERQRKSNIRNFQEERIEEIIINKGKIDPLIMVSLTTLVILGVIMVFSASYYVGKVKFEDIFHFFTRQSIYAIIGFMSLFIITKLDWEIYKKLSGIVFLISIILLLLVLVFGVEVNNAKRWLEIFDIRFQPSEIAKITLILYLSRYLVDNKKVLNTWSGFFKCCLIVLIPVGLIIIQNSASTAIIVGIIGMSIIFIASPRKIYFLPFILIGILGLVGLLVFGQGFRMARIIAWLDPFSETARRDLGFQTVQSLYAIASGGFFGLGIGQSRQKLGFIPEAQNDIIFSVICEELGFFGALIFVLLFATIIWRGYIASIRSPKLYMSYVCVGVTTMVAIQVIINIAVATNTMPNTGIPLPLVSYGGTSLIIMMVSIGIILNFSRYFKN